MGWAIVENEGGESTDPEVGHAVKKIREQLITYAGRLDLVALYMSRGGRGGYVPTGKAIAIDGEPGPPNEGAAMLANAAHAIYESDGVRQFQVRGYGETTKGNAKQIFAQAFRFGEGADDDGPGSKRAEKAESLELVTQLRGLIGDFHQWKRDDNEDRERLYEKIGNLVQQSAEQSKVIVEAMKLEHEQRREQWEHEYEVRRLDRLGAIGEKFAGDIGPNIGSVLEAFLRRHLDLDMGGVTGSFAQRLGSVWDSLSDEQREKCKSELGQDAWDLLDAARQAKNDQEFCNIISEIGPKIATDGKEAGRKFAKLLPIIGQKNFTTLAMLLKDAGLGG